MNGVVFVNDHPVTLEGESNLLDVIHKAGINLHTLCYNKELAPFGACRMCIVDVNGNLIPACTTKPTEGMRIKTHSNKVNKVRRMALELILSNHPAECQTCDKSGNCRLQEAANALGVHTIRFEKPEKSDKIDSYGPSFVRNEDKCILCGNCVRICNEIQGVNAISYAGRGSNSKIACAFDHPMGESTCVNCGQCLAVCPTGALTPLYQVHEVINAVNDENKLVVFQIAPAVRAAITEHYKLENPDIAMKKANNALKMIGVDYVFDTSWAADLTTIEEATEFLGRVEKGERLPLFTSCCPAWVKFAEEFYPEFLDNLSTCKSPQQMFSSYMKKYLGDYVDLQGKEIYVVSVMPCTAKKYEAARAEFIHDGVPETDVVITSQEFILLMDRYGIHLDQLTPIDLDAPFGEKSGAAVLFGVSGGVTEAVLRLATNRGATFTSVRGTRALKEVDLAFKGTNLRIAVVNGLSEVRKVLDKLKSGEVEYDIVEVMSCRGGCIGGGGQPIPNEMLERELRKETIYTADSIENLKNPADNPAVEEIYKTHLGEPNSHAAHELLHTAYKQRNKVTGQYEEIR